MGTMSKNLSPLTPESWAGMDPKAKWDSTVALRGPDVTNSDTIKWFSSSVIRGKLRGVMRVGGMINSDLNLVVVPYGERKWPEGSDSALELIGDRLWDGSHFFQHIREAAGWLGIPVLRLSGYWDHTRPPCSITKAIDRFVKEIDSKPKELAYHHLPKGLAEIRSELVRHKEWMCNTHGLPPNLYSSSGVQG